MADGQPRMVFLGFGKFVRSDRIYGLEPIRGEERGGGKRTRVWVEGIPEAVVASRTERTILAEMGQNAAQRSQLVDQAVDLAERIVQQTESGRVDLADLGRRARRLLEETTRTPEPQQLF